MLKLTALLQKRRGEGLSSIAVVTVCLPTIREPLPAGNAE